jgi:hypothetical protein
LGSSSQFPVLTKAAASVRCMTAGETPALRFYG